MQKHLYLARVKTIATGRVPRFFSLAKPNRSVTSTELAFYFGIKKKKEERKPNIGLEQLNGRQFSLQNDFFLNLSSVNFVSLNYRQNCTAYSFIFFAFRPHTGYGYECWCSRLAICHPPPNLFRQRGLSGFACRQLCGLSVFLFRLERQSLANRRTVFPSASHLKK